MGAHEREDGGVASVEFLRFYLDASMHVGIYRALRHVFPTSMEVLFPGLNGCPVSPGMRDEQWLPIVGRERWVVITRDKGIRTRPGQRQRLLDAGLRTFCLTAAGQQSKFDALKVLLTHWDAIEKRARELPGPYIVAVTASGLREAFIKNPNE